MKQFRTILGFEYSGYIKSRSYQVTTIVIVALILVAGFMPQIIGGISGLFSSDDNGGGSGGAGSADAAYIVSAEADADGIGAAITPEILDEATDYMWVEVEGDPETIAKNYTVTVDFKGDLQYDLYASGQDMSASYTTESIDAILITLAQQIGVSELPADVQGNVTELLNLTPEANLIQVGGDAESNFWLGYVLMFLLYMVIIMYGQFVVTSVVTEKSSKAMELLITSASPNSLMFGKVFGVGLVALTQIVLIFGAAILVINVNKEAWEDFMPMVFTILESSPLSFSLILYFVLFFVLGYFLYAFMYAALGSTVSKMEDASSVIMLPMMLVIVAFIISMIGLGNTDSFAIVVCSYIPFFSPMLMFSRICMGGVGTIEIMISLIILVATILLIGWLAARIYRMGVLMYGQKMGLVRIIKTALNNK